MLTALAAAKAPHIDWAALSPIIALLSGSVVLLMLGLFRDRALREVGVSALAIVTFATAAGLSIWQWDTNTDLAVPG